MSGRVTELVRAGGALLLDLDGTLVDSEPMHRAAFAAYFALRGWDVPDDVVRQFAGRRGHEAFAQVDGPWAGEDPAELTQGVVDALLRTTTRPLPVPGAASLLTACRELAVPTAVVTSARRSWAEQVLRGLGGWPVATVTAEDCTRGKPHPEPYLRGAQVLDVTVAAAVVAEDTPAGIDAARAAGVAHVIGMATTYPGEALLEAGADDVATDLRDLSAAVRAAAGGTGMTPRAGLT